LDRIDKLDNKLFLDIETVSVVNNFSSLSDRLQACWKTKAERLYPDLEIEESFYSKAGIYAEFAKIIVIGLGFFYQKNQEIKFKVKTLSGSDEKLLLAQFLETIQKFDQKKLLLCGHNGKEFDFPFLCRRLVINQLPLPTVLDTAGKKPWEVNHLDTLEMWKFGDKKSYTSLELLAATLDISSSKSSMDGSMVQDSFYKNGALKEIALYCAQDVVVTAQVYLRLKRLSQLQDSQIEYV
jgi:hypothetical protein